MRNNLVKILCEEAAYNKDLILITGDLGYNVLNKFYDVYPDQYINAGISEQNMMSVAAGLALSGKCVFTYSIGSFATLRCLEQIRNDVCYHNANVKVVALAAGFAYGALGMSHHATEDLAAMRGLPNMTIFSPCDPYETMAVTKAAVSLTTPCYIRLGRGGEPNIHETPLDDFQIGKAYQVEDGDDEICIFATGSILGEARKAVEICRKEGRKIPLFSFPTIKPIDKECIIACAKSHKKIITVEEHNIIGGLGTAVAEVLSEIEGEHASLKRIGMQDVFTSVVGDTNYLRRYYGLDANAILECIQNKI